jgi:hypothetical protein
VASTASAAARQIFGAAALAVPSTRPIEPAVAAPLLADLGFLASPDLPDRAGPAYLLVAIRPVPTERHYDPEAIDYWVTAGGRGHRETLDWATRLPLATDFSWGLIRIVDRLHVTNEYLTFGGALRADVIDGAVVAAFTSPVPLLRRGGHSQAIDPGADAVGAWFGRVLLAVDYVPGFERAIANADPTARYAAFLSDVTERSQRGPLRDTEPELAVLLGREARRIQTADPAAWADGLELRQRALGAGARQAEGPGRG